MMWRRFKRCWLCDTRKHITRHHVIPKSMNPRKNKIIPLCDRCHKLLNKNLSHCESPKREIVYFSKVKQKDGKYKVQGNISNGKVIFPDKSVDKIVKPGNYYDCLVHQIPHAAFARDIKEVNMEVIK